MFAYARIFQIIPIKRVSKITTFFDIYTNTCINSTHVIIERETNRAKVSEIYIYIYYINEYLVLMYFIFNNREYFNFYV